MFGKRSQIPKTFFLVFASLEESETVLNLESGVGLMSFWQPKELVQQER
jgi:hypothetical protein